MVLSSSSQASALTAMKHIPTLIEVILVLVTALYLRLKSLASKTLKKNLVMAVSNITRK